MECFYRNFHNELNSLEYDNFSLSNKIESQRLSSSGENNHHIRIEILVFIIF